jgi:hypothetical protein
MGTNVYAMAGELGVEVTVEEPDYAVQTASSIATVAGLTDADQQVNAVQGTAFSGTVDLFTDTAPDASGYGTSSYTVSIAWGDGNVTSHATLALIGTDTYSVSGSDTYAAAGSYPITITVTAPAHKKRGHS